MATIDFEFKATSGLKKRLSDYRGQYVVLYFYVKNNTPGCTTQSLDFTHLHPQFKQKNTVIFGITKDTLESQQKFKDKHEMPFDLIADDDETICKQFDVIKEKNLYGKKYMGIVRSTFLINPEGKIENEWRKVKVRDHAQTVLNTIK
jgi:thioredoxin-dependent peroxiredoxin